MPREPAREVGLSMSENLCALGIDLGTGSVKTVVLDAAGHQLAGASAPVRVSSPHPGWAESDPEEWWSAVRAAVRELVEMLDGTHAQIGAIGLSGQMHGVTLTTASSKPLRPAILHLDRRAQDDLDAYRALPEQTRAVLGNPLVPSMAGPLLHWLASHEPEVLGNAEWALQPKDWLRLRLIGSAGSEPSDASATLLFDLARSSWAGSVIAGLGLPSRVLPPIGRSGAVAGHLGAAAASELGLPPGTPVAFGCADTAAALVGTGLSDVGPVQLTVGSAAQIVTLRRSPDPDPGLRYHVFASASPDRWYAMAAVQIAGIAISWALAALAATWEEAYEALANAPTGANRALFVPHLTGARSPSMDPSAGAGFVGLELHHERTDLLRAVFEGVAFSIAEAAAALPEFAGTPVVHLAGGGTLQTEWRQLLCDVLGKKLLVVENPNASARGAALIGGQATGIIREVNEEPVITREIEPDPQSHASLSQVFERWEQAAAALSGWPV
jgi:xylulokinase